MNSEEDIYYMKMALQAARDAGAAGEVPIGAVIVYDPIDAATRKHILDAPQVVSVAANCREQDADPTGHAEFAAIKEAAQKLGRWRLSGCTVYVTLEPCLMCAGLMYQSRIDACVYGASDPKGGALGSLYSINSDERLNHNFDVRAGVLEEECAKELRDFFRSKRARNKEAKRQRNITAVGGAGTDGLCVGSAGSGVCFDSSAGNVVVDECLGTSVDNIGNLECSSNGADCMAARDDGAGDAADGAEE